MIKVYCDRCGKEVGEYEVYTIFAQAPEIKSWGDDMMFERISYQMCKDCMKETDAFITANKKRSE